MLTSSYKPSYIGKLSENLITLKIEHLEEGQLLRLDNQRLKGFLDEKWYLMEQCPENKTFTDAVHAMYQGKIDYYKERIADVTAKIKVREASITLHFNKINKIESHLFSILMEEAGGDGSGSEDDMMIDEHLARFVAFVEAQPDNLSTVRFLDLMLIGSVDARGAFQPLYSFSTSTLQTVRVNVLSFFLTAMPLAEWCAHIRNNQSELDMYIAT